MNAIDLTRHPHEQFRGEAERLAVVAGFKNPVDREEYIQHATAVLAYQAFLREIEPIRQAFTRAMLDTIYCQPTRVIVDGRIERLPIPPDAQKLMDELSAYIQAAAVKFGFQPVPAEEPKP